MKTVTLSERRENRMGEVVNLIERYGRAHFSRRIEQEEDEYAKEQFYKWLDQQRCSFCGGDPDFLSWFLADEHYCFSCARKAGIIGEELFKKNKKRQRRKKR